MSEIFFDFKGFGANFFHQIKVSVRNIFRVSISEGSRFQFRFKIKIGYGSENGSFRYGSGARVS